jgi:hypothetical protein
MTSFASGSLFSIKLSTRAALRGFPARMDLASSSMPDFRSLLDLARDFAIALSQQLFGNNDSLNLGCAFPDLTEFGISKVSLYGTIFHVAGATMNLEGLVSGARGYFRREEFGFGSRTLIGQTVPF